MSVGLQPIDMQVRQALKQVDISNPHPDKKHLTPYTKQKAQNGVPHACLLNTCKLRNVVLRCLGVSKTDRQEGQHGDLWLLQMAVMLRKQSPQQMG